MAGGAVSIKHDTAKDRGRPRVWGPASHVPRGPRSHNSDYDTANYTRVVYTVNLELYQVSTLSGVKRANNIRCQKSR